MRFKDPGVVAFPGLGKTYMAIALQTAVVQTRDI